MKKKKKRQLIVMHQISVFSTVYFTLCNGAPLSFLFVLYAILKLIES